MKINDLTTNTIKYIHGGGSCFCFTRTGKSLILQGEPNTPYAVQQCKDYCCTTPGAKRFEYRPHNTGLIITDGC